MPWARMSITAPLTHAAARGGSWLASLYFTLWPVASKIASSIFLYPVQPHTLPARHYVSHRVLEQGVFFSKTFATRSHLGVQNPHCTASHSMAAFCNGHNPTSLASPVEFWLIVAPQVLEKNYSTTGSAKNHPYPSLLLRQAE